MRLQNTQLSTEPTTCYECGGPSKRTLTVDFNAATVRLSNADGGQIELKTWEYGFTSDEPIQLTIAGPSAMICMVDGALLDTSGAGPHWICRRPELEEQQFHFTFSIEPVLNPVHGARVRSFPAGQPTLIIRVKRSCPTGTIQPTAVD
jgi:hypothetical protein